MTKNELILTIKKEAHSLTQWAEALADLPDDYWTLRWVNAIIEDESNWNGVLNALREYRDTLEEN